MIGSGSVRSGAGLDGRRRTAGEDVNNGEPRKDESAGDPSPASLGVGEGISLISAACGRGVVAGVCIELRVLEVVGGETERLGVSGGLCGLCPRIEPCAVGDAGTAMEIGRAAGSRVRVARPSTARCAEENVLCDVACERVRVWRCFTSLSLGDGGRAIREGRTDAWERFV